MDYLELGVTGHTQRAPVGWSLVTCHFGIRPVTSDTQEIDELVEFNVTTPPLSLY